MMGRLDMQNAYLNQSFIQNKDRIIASDGSTCGPTYKGVIWVTTAACSFQGVLYSQQRHTLTTVHFPLKPTANAGAQTHTIMLLEQQISRADHTIRGHSDLETAHACRDISISDIFHPSP